MMFHTFDINSPTVFSLFAFLSTSVAMTVICCCKRKKKKKQPNDEEHGDKADVRSKEHSKSKSKTRKSHKAKSKASEHPPPPPIPPANAVGKNEYATLMNIENKMEASNVKNDEDVAIGKKTKIAEKVSSSAYGTLIIAQDNALKASIMKRNKKAEAPTEAAAEISKLPKSPVSVAPVSLPNKLTEVSKFPAEVSKFYGDGPKDTEKGDVAKPNDAFVPKTICEIPKVHERPKIIGEKCKPGFAPRRDADYATFFGVDVKMEASHR